MKKRKMLIKIIAIVLAVLMLGSLVVSVLMTVAGAAGEASSSIDELQDEQAKIQQKKKELEAKKNELANQKAQIKSNISSLENERYTALQKKRLLDENIEITNQEINNISETIAELDREIEIKNQEYQKALDEEAAQMEVFKRRLRAIEENGTISYYEILFDAKSFSELLSLIDSIGEILRSDEIVIKQMEKARALVVVAQQELYDTKDVQKAEMAALEVKKAELQKDMEEANAYISGIESEIAAYEADAEANKASLEKIQAELKAQEAAQIALDDKIKRLQREQQGINAGVYAKGDFMWPSDDSKLVTSKYGLRQHPILGYTTMHNGIDIGAHYGTNIRAADGGIVMISEYSSSYGNYVMINHGNGRYTLYAHMSKRLVSVDDKVSQGDIIGLVGSTGYSTGPHVHFEIQIDEKRTDPLQFFSDYTIWD